MKDLGRLLVPKFACSQYRNKHDVEGPYEREAVLFHLPIHWWFKFWKEPTDFQARGSSVKRWQVWNFCRKGVDSSGPFGVPPSQAGRKKLFCISCVRDKELPPPCWSHTAAPPGSHGSARHAVQP